MLRFFIQGSISFTLNQDIGHPLPYSVLASRVCGFHSFHEGDVGYFGIVLSQPPEALGDGKGVEGGLVVHE
jgi:hypothetical protein